ncbi:MAG: carboxypeptidase regulatory-like domain-containing protein [Leptospiraceae bacterium]|nr:carboxypeptidase regulatory-like domain-containing protein [Leptospiraceae bacterium]MCP5511728.1 carboxypeptidase regulatory-like domain-containing protein [Leptospiraceae bacterium]
MSSSIKGKDHIKALLNIFLIVMVSFFTADCGGKKKKALLVPWMTALMGGDAATSASTTSTASGTANVDSNGVPLPQSLGESVQEVPTVGSAVVTGTIRVSDCKNDSGATIECSNDAGLDITQVILQLVDSTGTVLATTNPAADGSYSFNLDELNNGNYRVLVNSGNGVNSGYTDFNYVNDPTNDVDNITVGELDTTRLYLSSGPAEIAGKVTTPGFIDQSGGVVVPSGGLANVTVTLKDSSGNTIATTTTDADGNYSFTKDSSGNDLNLSNGNYVVSVNGAGQSQGGQAFTDIDQNVRFVFSGNDPTQTTTVNVNTISSSWNPATSATATISDWTIKNVAIADADLSGFTVTLKNENGVVVATTTTDASGKFSFSENLGSGVYSIEVSKDGFITSNSSFSFTASPTGNPTVVSQGSSITMIPRPSNITGSVSGANNQPPRIAGASINFRPATNQPPSSLVYLTQASDEKIRNLATLWVREACLNLGTTCVNACGAGGFQAICVAQNQGTGPWTYNTLANKVYEVKEDNVTVFFTAVAGKWEYTISAPGYKSTTPAVVTLNGQDVSFPPFTLEQSTHRGRIEGQTAVHDTLSNGTTKNVYGGTTPGYTANAGLPGLFVVMLGNTDSNNNPVIHITTTGANGAYKFDGNSKVVNLPSSSVLCSNSALVNSVLGINSTLSESTVPTCSSVADSLKVGFAISQYSNAPTLATASTVSGTNATDSVFFDGTNYQFKQGSYGIITVDPIKHLSASSTTAELNETTVPVSGGLLSVTNNILHLPRKNISGTISDAISTGALSGATITLGLDTNPDPNIVSFSDSVYRDDDTLPVNVPRINPANGSRADIQVPSVTTDANGNYSISNVDPGEYVLKIEKSGYETIYISVTVPATGGSSVTINGQTVESGSRGNVSGRVLLAGGAQFTGSYNLELIHPTAGTRPTAPIQPSSLTSGTTNFSNAPNYNIFQVNSGVWKIKFTAAGYVAVEGLLTVQKNTTTNFDIVTMIPGSQAPASISGKVINAFNNRNITSGLTITLRPGINSKSGPLALDANNQTIAPITSAADGSYVIPNVPAGNYTVEVAGNGFATTYQTVISAGNNSGNQNIFVSPTLAADEVRIVLAWGEKPADLDSHLEYDSVTNLDEGKYPQVVWNNKSRLNGNLTLDVDDVDGYGPETTTLKGSVWSKPRRGYSIYNYRNDAPMSVSAATIKVFKSTGLVRTYNAGQGQVNRWWQIFCLDEYKNLKDVGQPGCSASDFFNKKDN